MVWLNEDNTGPAEGTQICRAGEQFTVDKIRNLDYLCKFCIYNGKCKASAQYRKAQNNSKLSKWS